MKLFAIRHIPTGHYLPGRTRKKNDRGFTFDVPYAMGDCIPRLFVTEKSAKAALRAWLKGKHHSHWDVDGGIAGYERIEPVPSRKPEEMEVVPMLLI